MRAPLALPNQPAQPVERARSALRALAVGLVLAALPQLAGCTPASSLIPPQPELTEQTRTLYARRSLHDARRLVQEGRLESAERVCTRGLEVAPNDTVLLRLRSEIRASLGRVEEAAADRERADQIAPPRPALPSTPLSERSDRLVVTFVTPAVESEGERAPRDWPHGELASQLEQRLHVRLPHAKIARPPEESVAQLGDWLALIGRPIALSLRVDRAWCGETIKDGRFALAWIRASLATPDVFAASLVRKELSDPPTPARCASDAVAWALERVFERLALADQLAQTSAETGRAVWSRASIRALFPELEQRIAVELVQGRRLLSAGRLADAALAFARARAIDPGDLDTQTHLSEVELSLTLSGQLSAPHGSGSPSDLADPADLASQLRPEQRQALERLLREERERRSDLLAALEGLSEERAAPSAQQLAGLRPGEISNPDARGPALARQLAPGRIEVRHLYAHDGQVIARYYFATGVPAAPLLKEEDTTGDDRPDRWTSYRAGVRHTVWERGAPGEPDLRLTFGSGGDRLELVALDANGDGRPERVFRYEEGALVGELRDTTGDGRFDHVEHFDETGSLTLREEDFDGDDEVDVRTAYRNGRIVRRQFVNPELASEIE